MNLKNLIHHNHWLFFILHHFFRHIHARKHTRAGNSLIVNSGLSDLAVSIVIFPISIINLLAMSKDDDLASLSVCKFQWFLAACTFLISVLTLTVSSFIHTETNDVEQKSWMPRALLDVAWHTFWCQQKHQNFFLSLSAAFPCRLHRLKTTWGYAQRRKVHSGSVGRMSPQSFFSFGSLAAWLPACSMAMMSASITVIDRTIRNCCR